MKRNHMNAIETETLYKKVGRKYVPVSRYMAEDFTRKINIGQFILVGSSATDSSVTYCYTVTPDTAGFVAASQIARGAMTKALVEQMRQRPMKPQPFTKAQRKAIDECAQKIGMDFPAWWSSSSVSDIVDAGIKAVRYYASGNASQK